MEDGDLLVNGERVDKLLDPIKSNALRAEVREFANRPQDEQLIQLYLAVRQRGGIWGHVASAGVPTTGLALLAYKVFGGSWPL